MTADLPLLGVLGGTGPQGSGLALRWARSGHRILIGGRDPEKCRAAAAELNERLGQDAADGTMLEDAAARADIVILAVPYAVQLATAESVALGLAGKILIDVTAPLVPPDIRRVQLPPGGSASLALQDQLGPQVRVVSAFQNVSARHLADLDHDIDCDVLVCGDDEGACEAAMGLVQAAGMRGWRAGPLANAAAAEAMTSVLLEINRRHRIAGAGLRITGQPRPHKA